MISYSLSGPLNSPKIIFTFTKLSPSAAQSAASMSTKKTPKNDPKWAHLTTPKNYKLEELQRYQHQVGGGGWTIKIMTFGLFGATAYFTYILHSRKRLPWQHNEKVSPRRRNNLALPCTLSLHDLCLVRVSSCARQVQRVLGLDTRPS